MIIHVQSVMSIESFHRGLSGLVDVSTFQHLHDGNPYHLDVRPQRAVVHIPYIQFELLRPADGVTPVTLRPAADTRSHLMASRLFLIV